MISVIQFAIASTIFLQSWFVPTAQLEERSKWEFPQPTVIIDVGHGGIDGGAYYGNVLEKNVNLQIARKLYEVLQNHGINVVLNRAGDYALSEENHWSNARTRHGRDLSQRKQLTEEIDSKILVSLHCNASPKPSSSGPLVLHQPTGESILLAQFIQNALNQQQQTYFLPKLGKTYYLLKKTQKPAVIVEMGFISNEQDRQMLTDPASQHKIAEAIASGIGHYHWLLH
ncbi:N-acetylmuramoyl-L-alanine amidase [Paenibacillus yanchengensis]|uniref:N-acetylmuramoyl-L-alanine amidase n=1 Tax=Paenibacillus yanchengensis TaxID=2035833 RepID=A0ABW4YKU8_9BACL